MKRLHPKLVHYYIGEQGFINVCERSLEKAENEIIFFGGIMSWYKVYSINYDNKHYIPKRIKKGIKLRMLTNKTIRTERMKEKDKELLREIRFLKDEYKLNSTFIIYKNEVCIMISKEPYLGIVIESKEVYESMLNIFNNIWDNQTD